MIQTQDPVIEALESKIDRIRDKPRITILNIPAFTCEIEEGEFTRVDCQVCEGPHSTRTTGLCRCPRCRAVYLAVLVKINRVPRPDMKKAEYDHWGFVTCPECSITIVISCTQGVKKCTMCDKEFIAIKGPYSEPPT